MLLLAGILTLVAGKLLYGATQPLVDNRALHAKFPLTLYITMREGTDRVMSQISTTRYRNIAEKRTAIYNSLKAHVTTTQESLLKWLKLANSSLELTSYWITNQIRIRNVSFELLNRLRTREDIAKIDLEQRFRLDGGHSHNDLRAVPAPSTPGYNLDIMGVPRVWGHGFNGSGVVVGIFDTGVRYTHEALRDSFKGDDYSWFDPINDSPTPYDDQGRGTLVAGLVAGSHNIGVAPGAKWIACKAFDAEEIGNTGSLLACGEFMMCPSKVDGSGRDCTQAPQVVINSWNLPSTGGTWYDSLTEKLRAAEFLMISSAGSGLFMGVGCSSLGFPANHPDVLTVGATNERDGLWRLSGQGPTELGRDMIKPEVTAPGVGVVSTCIASDSSYCSGSGTFRAAAQVAGIIALLLSQAPCLQLAQAVEILKETASTDLKFTGAQCGGIPDNEFPNFRFGYGRADAFAAYECLASTLCLDRLNITLDESCNQIPAYGVPSNHMLLILGLVGGAAISMVTIVGIYFRKRQLAKRRKEREQENSLYGILRQFRAGTWRQIYVDVLREPKVQAAGSGNYIALTRPYDFGQYEIGSDSLEIDEGAVLGSGEFGVVYAGNLLLRDAAAQTTAVGVKKLKAGAQANCVASFLKELQIMIYVGEHLNIIQLLGACTQSCHIQDLCIVLQLGAHGNLENYLRTHRRVFMNQITEDGHIGPGLGKRISCPNYVYVPTGVSEVPIVPLTPINTESLMKWTIEIAAGMEFLAQRRVIHGDLACRNVLLDENLQAKVSDFGLASRLYEYTRSEGSSKSENEKRSLPWRWMPPESLQNMRFSTASDVWAFGITVWEIFSLAEVPYPGMVWGEEFLKQLFAGYRNLKPKYGTEEIYSILTQCWSHDPNDRPAISRLRELFTNLQTLVSICELS